jgi:hypothetical protein
MTIREGVFIPRRDTSSRLQSFVGGRIFPGVHHLADFKVSETSNEFCLAMRSRDGKAAVELKAHCTGRLPVNSVFASLAEASDFFARGSAGYSTTRDAGCWDGLELRTFGWHVEALEVASVRSSFFEHKATFPAGTVEFDCALLMRNVEHEWRRLPRLRSNLQTVELESGR